jgi:RNA polymerase sigma factor (sigma-70 family)
MAHTVMTDVTKQIETLFDGGTMTALTDAQLLERFSVGRDARGEAAFAELVARHGPMVLGVCNQILEDRHLAEDAFQATFLVLARRARTVSRSEWLGAWLHAVAARTARSARGRRARRLRREEDCMRIVAGSKIAERPSTPPDEVILAGEEASVLHGEIARLPDAFRLPVVLCYLEGLTVHEAASRLRVSHGTVRSRMARAREKLRRGLMRRGIIAPAAALAALLDASPASAAVSAPLATLTTRAAVHFAAGATRGAWVAASAAALAHRVLRSMLVHRLVLAGAVVVLLAVVAGGAGFAARALTSGGQPAKLPESPPPSLAQAAAAPADSAKSAIPAARTLRVVVLDPEGRPAPNVHVLASVWTDEKDFKANRDYSSDAAGAALIALPRTYRIVRLFVSKPPLVPMFTHWEEDELAAGKKIPEEYTIRLERGASAGGRILDEGGKPIAGAKVRVKIENSVRPAQGDSQTAYNGWLAEGDDAAITDADGRWRINNVPSDAKVELSLLVTHPDHVSDEHWGEAQRAGAISTEKLLQKSAELRLKSGTVVRGRVTDDAGKPIAGAIVVRGDDPYFASTRSEFLTDADGRFRLPALGSGKVALTIVAPGWAPQDRMVDVRPGLPEQDFRMARGRPIRLRFVDPGGKPLPQAYISIRRWNGRQALHNHDHPNVRDSKIPRHPGADGVWEWTWAPETPVALSVSAIGCAAQDLELAGGAPERTVVLKPEHRVRGSVTDAATGRPIPAFSVIPVDVFRKDFLSAEPDNGQSGEDGRLDFLVTRADIPIRLRVQALGYRTQDGPEFRTGDDGARTQDFRLQPSPPITGRIVDAAGRPAPGVHIALATPTNSVSVLAGRTDQKASTDPAGRFAFPDPGEPWAVVARSETGFVLGDGQFSDDRHEAVTLTLRPYATIRGQFRDGDRPVPGAMILLQFICIRDSAHPWLDNNAEAAITGPDGRFEFKMVPPVPLNLRVNLGPWKDEQFRSGPNVPLDLQPGQHVEIDLGGSGATVTGKVKLIGNVPPDLDCNYSLNYLIRREPGIPPPPEIAQFRFDVRSGWRDAWFDGAEGDTYLRTLRYWFVKLAPDGAFRISGVPAGEYDLSVRVYAKPSGCLVEPLARAVTRVTVTGADAARGQLALPEVPAPVVPIPAAGDRPRLAFTRADGTGGSLAEFRGSYTLVHFWASWCAPCHEQLPALRRLNGRLAVRGLKVLSLSVDSDGDAWRHAIQRDAAPWDQGRLSSPDGAGVSGVPAYWLIDPEGRIVQKATDLDELIEPLTGRLR